MDQCPECNSSLFEYMPGEWKEGICWECGHYESDSPAYKACPKMFVNLVRENPQEFIKKYLFSIPPQMQHHDKTPEDATEPVKAVTASVRE